MRNTDFDNDTLLKAAFTVVGETEMKNQEQPENVEFSKEHLEKMERLFAAERKRQRIIRYRKYASRAAAVFVAGVFAAGVSVYSVEAWRVKFINFVLDRKPTHTEIRFSEQPLSNYTVNGITLNYIPKGFYLVGDYSKTGEYTELEFQNDEGRAWSFSCKKVSESLISAYDTEDAEVTYFNYRGFKAMKSIKDRIQILVWYNSEHKYDVLCDLGEEELMKIADNIDF